MKTNKPYKFPASAASTTLERHVLGWLNDKGRDYETGALGALKDLQQGGGSSGIISHLIYTADCVKFYKRHRWDISALLAEALENSGESGPSGIFSGWDDTDPLALDDANMNLLAWFGFEEAAQQIAMRAEGEQD